MTSDSKTRRPRSSEAQTGARFPIVGIGASAGGLDAFKKLLGRLPDNTGMAFVLVQHLSPRHQSLLPELISKATPMPVLEVKDGMRVKPDHVYVIPPNASMGILAGALRLLPREAHERPHLAIDFFLRSLAQEQRNEAIGVILSGTGSDGAEGLKQIKGEGGITFAQSPESAKFEGMPARAIAVDHVDFILSPEEIAQELIRLSKHPFLKKSYATIEEEKPRTEDGADLSKILLLVRQFTGVDFSHYKQTTVQRRIMRRMVVHKMESLERYLAFLKENRSEVTMLQNDILINVTSFFRDPEAFEALKAVVFPKLLQGKSHGDPIRIWIPGCATGEEAYSIAIVLLEFLADKANQHQIQIFASDLSEACISKARAAKYTDGISENVSPERLSRFFIRSERGFQVSKSVRDLCVFARQDLVKDPPYSRLDLISCRNVLIYFEPALQRRTLGMFQYALNPNGVLVLGSSETPEAAAGLFAPIEKKLKLYSVNPGTPQARPALSAAPSPRVESASMPARPTAGRHGSYDAIERETDRLIATHCAPPSVVITENLEIIQFRGDTTPYLVNPTGKASFNILKMAKDGLPAELNTLIIVAKKGALTKSDLIRVRHEGEIRPTVIEVVPLSVPLENRCFLVMFRTVTLPPATGSKPETEASAPPPESSEKDLQIAELSRDLAATRAYLESLNHDLEGTNQDLQSANEEVLSANEELQSTNEELETAKEELQSTNEELTTVNDELQSRNNELDQLNNDLVNLVGSVEIPILMISRDGRIRRLTPAAEKVLSLMPSDVGRPIREIKSNFEVLKLDLDLEQKVAEVVESMGVTQTEVQDRGGHWYRLQVRPYRTIDNKIEGAVIALLDIDSLKRGLDEIVKAKTEAERARASAEAGNRAKDLFLATLSHELRTPLTAILSYVQLMKLGKLDAAGNKKGLAVIEQSAQAQAQLINDLLDVSRIIMGKLSLDIQDVDPAVVLLASVESVRPIAEQKQIRIEAQIPPTERVVSADPTRLKQVFLNLLTNAIKFSTPNSKVDVTLQLIVGVPSEQVCIQVRDYGKGIPAEFIPHIFDRFSQADSTSTRLHGGMGLGLAIVRSLVEQHRGTVEVMSAGIGKGATFTINLPLKPQAELYPSFHVPPSGADALHALLPLGEDKASEVLHPDLAGIRILVVDDDTRARETVSLVLSSFGALVEAAESAAQAFSKLPRFQPDVLLCDIAMPGEDGYSLIKRIRSGDAARGATVPAIALTAYAGGEDVSKALSVGFQKHLTKPVDSIELANAVVELAETAKRSKGN